MHKVWVYFWIAKFLRGEPLAAALLEQQEPRENWGGKRLLVTAQSWRRLPGDIREAPTLNTNI